MNNEKDYMYTKITVSKNCVPCRLCKSKSKMYAVRDKKINWLDGDGKGAECIGCLCNTQHSAVDPSDRTDFCSPKVAIAMWNRMQTDPDWTIDMSL